MSLYQFWLKPQECYLPVIRWLKPTAMKPVLFTLFPRSEERVGKRSDAGVSKLADNTTS
jgi:hypothetical protein